MRPPAFSDRIEFAVIIAWGEARPSVGITTLDDEGRAWLALETGAGLILTPPTLAADLAMARATMAEAFGRGPWFWGDGAPAPGPPTRAPVYVAALVSGELA